MKDVDAVDGSNTENARSFCLRISLLEPSRACCGKFDGIPIDQLGKHQHVSFFDESLVQRSDDGKFYLSCTETWANDAASSQSCDPQNSFNSVLNELLTRSLTHFKDKAESPICFKIDETKSSPTGTAHGAGIAQMLPSVKLVLLIVRRTLDGRLNKLETRLQGKEGHIVYKNFRTMLHDSSEKAKEDIMFVASTNVLTDEMMIHNCKYGFLVLKDSFCILKVDSLEHGRVDLAISSLKQMSTTGSGNPDLGKIARNFVALPITDTIIPAKHLSGELSALQQHMKNSDNAVIAYPSDAAHRKYDNGQRDLMKRISVPAKRYDAAETEQLWVLLRSTFGFGEHCTFSLLQTESVLRVSLPGILVHAQYILTLNQDYYPLKPVARHLDSSKRESKDCGFTQIESSLNLFQEQDRAQFRLVVDLTIAPPPNHYQCQVTVELVDQSTNSTKCQLYKPSPVTEHKTTLLNVTTSKSKHLIGGVSASNIPINAGFDLGMNKEISVTQEVPAWSTVYIPGAQKHTWLLNLDPDEHNPYATTGVSVGGLSKRFSVDGEQPNWMQQQVSLQLKITQKYFPTKSANHWLSSTMQKVQRSLKNVFCISPPSAIDNHLNLNLCFDEQNIRSSEAGTRHHHINRDNPPEWIHADKKKAERQALPAETATGTSNERVRTLGQRCFCVPRVANTRTKRTEQTATRVQLPQQTPATTNS